MGLMRFRRFLRNRGKHNWFLLILGNALVLAFMLSATLLVGEIYFRFIYDSTDALAYTKVCRAWFNRHWRLNDAQCRDDMAYFPETNGLRRITFFGDSFAAGHGVDLKDTFFVRIREGHPDWQIHCIAQPGAETAQEQTNLNLFVEMHYQLADVVLVYCLNDVSDLMPNRAALTNSLAEDKARQGWLFKNSYCLNFFYWRWSSAHNPWMKGYFDFIAETSSGPVWEKQKERLRKFKRTVEKNGGHLRVVTFPFLHALGPNYQYQGIHDALDKFWKEEGVPHLDLLNVYQTMKPSEVMVNRFDPHPNKKAHELAAAAIADFLK